MIFAERVKGENKPHRWEWIKENHPDFDLFIDDNHALITSTRDHLGEGKYYAMPDYKGSRHIQADNIYHIKTSVSDLKDEDFVK